jgi:uncharacterized membrane protein
MADESRLYAAFAYLLFIISGIIVFLIRAKDGYARFHAMQSILLTIALFVISFVLGVIGRVLDFIPFVGSVAGLMIYLISAAISLATFLLWLFLMWKAYSGERYMLPFIGAHAESMARKA